MKKASNLELKLTTLFMPSEKTRKQAKKELKKRGVKNV